MTLPPAAEQWLIERRATGNFAGLTTLATHRSDRYTAKAWILPDGRAVAIDGWHYEWILAHRAQLQRELGLDLSAIPPSEDPIRRAAVKAGFFRANYLYRAGELTFEGLESRQSLAVREAMGVIALESLRAIDRLQLYLFDDDISVVSGSHSLRLVTLDTAERVTAILQLLAIPITWE